MKKRDAFTEGRKYRLPTEAEWEHACRAGTKTAIVSATQCREWTKKEDKAGQSDTDNGQSK